MAAVVAEFVGSSVTASDIFDDGYGIAPVDFLNDPHLVCPAWIITESSILDCMRIQFAGA